MRKSKPSQLTGAEGTPGESVPQRVLLLLCWGLREAAGGDMTGTGDEGGEDGAGAAKAVGAGAAVGLVFAHDGPQVAAGPRG